MSGIKRILQEFHSDDRKHCGQNDLDRNEYLLEKTHDSVWVNNI